MICKFEIRKPKKLFEHDAARIIFKPLGASRKNPYCVNAISRKVFGKPAPNKC